MKMFKEMISNYVYIQTEREKQAEWASIFKEMK